MKAVLCRHQREQDGARCVLNKGHSWDHGYAYRYDPVPALLAEVERLRALLTEPDDEHTETTP